jgi:sterol 24-C-methyltransferase
LLGNKDSDAAISLTAQRVNRYYYRIWSRLGYGLLLHGTRHFGWYEPGQSKWKFRAAIRRMEDVLAQRLALPEGSAVLDAGCGMGDVARTLAGKYGLSVTGIDILDFNLEEARRRSLAVGLEGKTRFLKGNYHDLIFPNESFDGIYTMETFVHAADPGRALSEFYRVLKPGGRLVMHEYSRTPAEELSDGVDEILRLICDLGAMPTFLNHGELEKLIEKTDFIVDSGENATSRMEPMVHAFYILGRFPYSLARISGHQSVNAMSAVEFWRHQDAGRYNIYVAHKPE